METSGRWCIGECRTLLLLEIQRQLVLLAFNNCRKKRVSYEILLSNIWLHDGQRTYVAIDYYLEGICENIKERPIARCRLVVDIDFEYLRDHLFLKQMAAVDHRHGIEIVSAHEILPSNGNGLSNTCR